MKKKKSPSQLRREEKRKAAREDLKKTSDTTVTVAESLDFKCNDCDQVFKTEKVLNIHIGKLHKDLNPSTPEKVRINSNIEEPTLTLTPSVETRDEEVDHTIPEKEDTFKCEYCKYPPREFESEAELSIHHSKRHSYQQENIGRIHQCPICKSNSSLTLAIRNNYYTQNDLNTHIRIIHENLTNSIVIAWDGFFVT